MSKDYYKILGVAKNASADEIKRAYRRLAQQHHPDKGGNQEKFKEISEAYQILSDPQRRAQYDQYGTTFEQARAQGGFQESQDFSSFADAFNFFGGGRQRGRSAGFGFEDIFENVFGGSQRGRRHAQRGQDITVDAEISLEEAYTGVNKEINLRKAVACERCGGTGAQPGSKLKQCPTCKGNGQIEQRTSGGFFNFSQIVVCPDCGGSGKKPEKACDRCGGDGRVKEEKKIAAKIPAGIQDGQVMSISGQGEAGAQSAPAGDLYITIHVRPDPRFRREGNNLFYELPISFTQAVLGDKVDVPTLTGWVKLKISEGVESGTLFRLEGKGMPRLQGRGFGDMIVKVKIKIPKRISKKTKELLEELKKEAE